MTTISPIYKYVTVLLIPLTTVILFLSWDNAPEIEYIWNMNSSEEYKTRNMTGRINNGIYEGCTSGSYGDPKMILRKRNLHKIRLNADQYKIFEARIFLDERLPDNIRFSFFIYNTHGYYKYKFNAQKGWHEYKVDMSKYPKWSGVLDKFRLDFVEGLPTSYDIKVDWIKFSPAQEGED